MSNADAEHSARKGGLSTDLGIIRAAFRKAIEHLQPMIGDFIEDVIYRTSMYAARLLGRFASSAVTAMHCMLHVLAHCWHSARDFFREVFTYRRRSRIRRLVCSFANILAILKPPVRSFRVSTWKSRRINLFRRQDRGSKEPASGNEIIRRMFA